MNPPTMTPHQLTITQKTFLAKGNRGIVYTGYLGKKKVAIKEQRPEKKPNTIALEGQVLADVNKRGIGPKLYHAEENYIIMEFIDGKKLRDFLAQEKKKEIQQMLKNVFEQMFTLDQLHYTKEEMHHPWKHVIITKKGPVLIDFERCRKTPKPKNVTQFCQFVASGAVTRLMQEKDIALDRDALLTQAAHYKKAPTKQQFLKIFKAIN